METTKNTTAKEREFIAAVEANRNAEGKMIAWYICANGNGKVIFENAAKDRYSCAYAVNMEGGYFLHFVGERAGHPYDRKTYKRKGNALKGFKMREGHNEPPTFAATATETPQISTQTAETVNVSAEGENAGKTPEMPQILNCERKTVEHFKAIPNIYKLAEAGIIINGVGWHTEYLDQSHNVLARVDNLGLHEDGKGFGGFQGSGVFGKTAIFESWEDAVIATIDALTDYLRAEPKNEPRETEMSNSTTFENDAQILKKQLAKNRSLGTTMLLELPDGTELRARYSDMRPMSHDDQYIYKESKNGHVRFSATCCESEVISRMCLKLGLTAPEAPQTAQSSPQQTNSPKSPENGQIGHIINKSTTE